ncbi:MAG: hypothetical protein ACKODS_04205, partial [Methylophilaceae bacterium]
MNALVTEPIPLEQTVAITNDSNDSLYSDIRLSVPLDNFRNPLKLISTNGFIFDETAKTYRSITRGDLIVFSGFSREVSLHFTTMPAGGLASIRVSDDIGVKEVDYSLRGERAGQLPIVLRPKRAKYLLSTAMRVTGRTVAIDRLSDNSAIYLKLGTDVFKQVYPADGTVSFEIRWRDILPSLCAHLLAGVKLLVMALFFMLLSFQVGVAVYGKVTRESGLE